MGSDGLKLIGMQRIIGRPDIRDIFYIRHSAGYWIRAGIKSNRLRHTPMGPGGGGGGELKYEFTSTQYGTYCLFCVLLTSILFMALHVS